MFGNCNWSILKTHCRLVNGWQYEIKACKWCFNNGNLEEEDKQKGLVWHSDRGSQYASDSHRNILKDHKIIQSMSRKGDCWNNAVAESFFHTLKTELTNHYQFENQQEAKNVIFEYIEVFYNRIRIHSANNYLAPVEFEERNRYLKKSLGFA